ncbi:hypothetical protein SEUCBS139899_005967 [Sporothrix eucalyptigena]
MASGRHLEPDPAMFFGYSIGEDPTFLQNAPEPAPGAPLLDDSEHDMLNTWFEDMKSDDRTHGNIISNGIHLDNWLDVPQFVGSTTHLGLSHGLQHASLGDHIFSQDVLSSPSLVLAPAPGQMPPSRPMPPNMTPVIAPTPRSNSSPALPLHMGSVLGHSFSIMPGASLGIEQSPSDDMVAAANTLLSNGHHGTRHSSFNYGPRLHLSQPHHSLAGLELAPGPLQPVVAAAASPSALLPNTGHSGGSRLRTASLASSATPVHMTADLGTVQPSGLVFPNDTNTSQQILQSVTMVPVPAPVHRQELQWGTDQSFSQKQFTPRSEKETSEALMNIHFKSMECLEPNHSTGTTRPSSPTYDSAFAPLNLKTRTTSLSGAAEAGGNTGMAPPRKRRKGKGPQGDDIDKTIDEAPTSAVSAMAGEVEEEGPGLTKNGKPRKRKAKAASNGNPPSQSSGSPGSLVLNTKDAVSANGTNPEAAGDAGPAPTKRRRSAAVTKPPRENLTEEQKRENHIKSEQKRRTLIKTGFDDLCIIVPNLQGGNLSKSLILTTAASWLTDLLEGNNRLKNQLSAMDSTAFSA